MSHYEPGRYYPYEELSAYLEDVARLYPTYARLESIGVTPEERDIWVLSLTDTRRGRFDEKPAYWIDANTHASEVMGSAAALQTIHHVLTHLDQPEIAELLERITLYIAPRVNPDGAEYVLEKRHYVRSARRSFPDPAPTPGLIEKDIDDDGRVLQMRIESPQGAWKASEKDSRLLIPRRPWDAAGPFYHLYAEGVFEESSLQDPRRPMLHRDPHGLDFNRNYPYRWRPEPDQAGAGDYPLSEPETRAVVDYLLAHKNVCGMLTYHTYSGVLLRPFSDKADSEMPKFDLETYKLFGSRCEEITGFKCVSTFHNFAYDPKNLVTGVFDDWAYEHYGVHCYTMELWCPWKHAGLDFSDDFLEFWRNRDEDTELALLKWNDDDLESEAFVDWYAYEHPQLGEVELGGWDWLFSFRNAPAERLEEECQPSVLFSLDHARALPQPRIELSVEEVEGELSRVRVQLINGGYLPTWVTELGKKRVGKLHLGVECGEGLAIAEGKVEMRVDHLDGLANMTVPNFGSQAFHGKTLSHLREHTWLVRGSGSFEVTWWGDRIGRHVATVQV